jgi:glycosyltransferase involved in cell wall biosynthesis
MKTGHPLVSVIVPCYNQARFLRAAVDSLQAQTFSHWECIIINDGSNDNTDEMAKALSLTDQRVRLLSQPNRGLSDARNRGLSEARGDYVQFLDADDLIEQDKFLKQVNHLVSHPEHDVVYSDARYFPAEQPEKRLYSYWGEERPWVKCVWEDEGTFIAKLVQRNVMPVNAPLLRKAVVDDIGSFDISLKAAEDWDYWCRCATQGVRFHFLAAAGTLALIRFYPASMSRDRNKMRPAVFRARIKLGALISDPKIRYDNWRTGLHYLREDSWLACSKDLVELARANSSWKVRTRLPIELVCRIPLLRRFLKRLRCALHQS